MSQGKRVVVDGRLQGMDHDLSCKVEGTQTSAPGAVVFEMTLDTVSDLRTGLPDGIYELEYEGSAERVRKTGDRWELV